MIEVKDLYKAFGGVQAVRGVSFDARDGEVTGIIGPNGAGKTTIFRLIYTVLRPDRGGMFASKPDQVGAPICAATEEHHEPDETRGRDRRKKPAIHRR